MVTDRADELCEEPDLWPLVERHVERAIDAALFSLMDFQAKPTMRLLEEKYRRGEIEHGRAWLGMTIEEFDEEITAEVHDLVVYHAMRMLRWGRGRNGWVEP